ncbi:hypothetical protein CHISP_1188 [Chitinispirillum alkaliphilum]|nr:hypothetical protein CHISP_1188 [Chitinispirillum alkaliphilum]
MESHCWRCGKIILLVDNYGSEVRWLCFECSEIEKKRNDGGKFGNLARPY